jgi:spore coat protein A, manganese oxidase
MTGMSRRRLLGALGGAAAAAGVGVPLLRGLAGGTSTGTPIASRLTLPRPFQRPLPIPPAPRPVSTAGGVDRYAIVQRPGTAEMLPGVSTPIWGYDGRFPGPTLHSRSGRPVLVHHRNDLPIPTVVHLHGGHTPAESDGFPTDLVHPAGTDTAAAHADHPTDPLARITIGARDYRYPMRQRAATLWYHDHRMDFTGPDVWRGLAGFHIVTDDEEERLPLPRGDRDLPLMIADRSFAADGSLAYPDPAARAPGVLGDAVLVNGVAWPFHEVAGARYRLRLLNASNARRYRLVLDPPAPFVQIGTDGGLLEQPRQQDAIELAPAQRFDVVIDFARYAPGTRVRLVNTFGSGTTRNVLQFRVGSRDVDGTSVPAVLSAARTLRPVRTRTFRFRQDDVHGRPGWTINGAPFDPAVSIARPRLGETEVWRLTSDFHHPVHLHLGPFRVLSRGLGGPGPYDHGWKDTIDLRPAEEASLLVRFDDYPGRFVLHCHNLEHEDMAMMATFTTG